MIFYFSGCGNSKHVAETIAAGLNDSLIYIPEASHLFLGTTETSA